MAEFYKDILCVQLRDLLLCNDGAGWIPKSTLDTLKNRGHLNVIRRAAIGRRALVEFDTMRADIRERYIETYGDPHREEKNIRPIGVLESFVEPGNEAITYYSRVKNEHDEHMKPERIAELVLNARILTSCLKLRDYAKAGSVGASIRLNYGDRLFKAANELRDTEDSPYPHTLPRSASNFKKRLKEFETMGFAALIHKNMNNKHSAKIAVNEQAEALLHKLCTLHMNLDNAQVLDKYNMYAKSAGLEVIKSPQTVANFRERNALTIMRGQRGEKAFNAVFEKQKRRRAPEYPLYMITMDGWDVELFYQNRTKDSKGHNVTTYHNRLTVVVVLDPCTKYPLGYAIGTHENVALIQDALRDAVNHTKHLFGKRYRPIQIQSDNYQKKTLTPFYQGASKYFTPAAVGNAKSKIIEPWFRYINKKYCQLQPNWSGFGITSRKELQPNWSNVTTAMKQCLPDEQGCFDQIVCFMEKERAALREQYVSLWNEMPTENRLEFPTSDYLMLMGKTTGFCNSLTATGMNVTLLGNQLTYETFDLESLNHLNENWAVHYDPSDLSEILIVNARAIGGRTEKEIGTLYYTLEEKKKVSMSIMGRTEEDLTYMHKVSTFNNEIKQLVNDKEDAVNAHVLEISTQEQLRLEGDLNKFLITDSRGNHKDARNRARLHKNDLDVHAEDAQVEAVKVSDEDDFTWSEEDMLRHSLY